jgi:hypothetical protein
MNWVRGDNTGSPKLILHVDAHNCCSMLTTLITAFSISIIEVSIARVCKFKYSMFIECHFIMSTPLICYI